MYRKFTAIIQLVLMLVVVATSQPSVSYCLCADEVCIGGCPCDAVVEISKLSSESTPCCAECDAEASEIPEKTDTLVTPPKPLCPDCLVSILISIDDFTLSAASITESAAAVVAPASVAGGMNDILIDQIFKTPACGNRGSPPGMRLAYSVPLFVRYSVYLI